MSVEQVPIIRKSFLAEIGFLKESDIQEMSGYEFSKLATFESYLRTYGFDINMSPLISSGLINGKIIIEKVIQLAQKDDSIDELQRLARLFSSEKKYIGKLQKLIEVGYLNHESIFFLLNDPLFYKIIISSKFDLLSLIEKGYVNVSEFNRINYGLTNVPEFEAFWRDRIMKGMGESLSVGNFSTLDNYPIEDEVHPLQVLTRNTQDRDKLRGQLNEALGEDVPGSVSESIDILFEHFSTKSKQVKEIEKDAEIGSEQRKENAKKVNSLQLQNISADSKAKVANLEKFSLYSLEERCLDIYARYFHGQMDPLQLAIIAKTLDWYIKSGKSKLFTKLRFLPRHATNVHTPHIIKSVSSAKGVVAEGQLFSATNIGSNRIYLTHANAKESQNMFQIPIVATQVAVDSRKIDRTKKYVLFNASFDPANDLFQDRAVENLFFKIKSFFKREVTGDILGLIEETLRCVREVEELELKQVR